MDSPSVSSSLRGLRHIVLDPNEDFIVVVRTSEATAQDPLLLIRALQRPFRVVCVKNELDSTLELVPLSCGPQSLSSIPENAPCATPADVNKLRQAVNETFDRAIDRWVGREQ